MTLYTQPNLITHNLTTHHRAAHNPAARWGVGSVVCNLPRQQHRLAQRWPNVGTPACIAVWLVRLRRGLPIRVTHTTEPAHHRAAGLCAAWRCAARLSVIRLGCVEGHPWEIRLWTHKKTPLTGELWGVYCEDFDENWTRYIGTALNMYIRRSRRSISIQFFFGSETYRWKHWSYNVIRNIQHIGLGYILLPT